MQLIVRNVQKYSIKQEQDIFTYALSKLLTVTVHSPMNFNHTRFAHK